MSRHSRVMVAREESYDYYDTEQSYLQLRQCGRRVGWFVRAKGRSKKLGDASHARGEPPGLSPSKARLEAGKAYFSMKSRSALGLAYAGWTWSVADRHYQASVG